MTKRIGWAVIGMCALWTSCAADVESSDETTNIESQALGYQYHPGAGSWQNCGDSFCENGCAGLAGCWSYNCTDCSGSGAYTGCTFTYLVGHCGTQ